MKTLRFYICAALALVGMAACNKYETPLSISGGMESADSVSITDVVRKVLWVNIDGAVGSLVKQQTEQGALPTLQQMLAHSKYSWLGLADNREGAESTTGQQEEDPLTWASMLTGVSSTLHFIKDNSYNPDFPLDINPLYQEVNYFPTVIQYLGKINPSLQVSCVSPWHSLNRYVGDAHSVITTSSDKETQAALLDQLANDDYSFTLASFKGMLEAGRQGGFTTDNATYTTALEAVDGYLKQLIETIDARENAGMEDWLVIVTSNQGGTPEGHVGGTSDAERDIFGVFYYPHYTGFEMKGEIIDAARFSRGEWALAADTTALYGIGAKRNFSVEMNIRMLPRSNGTYNGVNWSCLVGKKHWGMFRQRLTVSLRATDNDNKAVERAFTACTDSRWHALYMGLGEVTGNTRKYLMSYDGIRQIYNDTECFGVENDSSYVVIGNGTIHGNDYIPNSYYVASLRLWDEIMEDAMVDQNASLIDISAEHPFRRHLVGEWRFSRNELLNDTIIPNRIEGMPDMIFKRQPTFVKVSNTLPDKLKSGNLVMENTLIAPQIIYWLCGASNIDSRLEGYNFLAAYALEEQWRDYQEE